MLKWGPCILAEHGKPELEGRLSNIAPEIISSAERRNWNIQRESQWRYQYLKTA